MKTTGLILLLMTSLAPLSFAEKWQNPANKYLNAYKKYLHATCPIAADNIQHFVYFARDRAAIKNHALLDHPMFQGAQIMYSWRDLEPQPGSYDFSRITADLSHLKQHNKKLFIQLQDVTFNPKYQAVPAYLLSDAYAGGAVLAHDDAGNPSGWVAKRWHPAVRARFALLLKALGDEFDGQIAGINLQETAINISDKDDPSFAPQSYVAGIQANMLALKQAFPSSTTMIYANFMPGEWLPFDDNGYLKSIYQYGEDIGVGLGGPDLMVTRKGQLNHALAQMHENTFTAPLGIAIQDGNYIGKTGADADYHESADQGLKKRTNQVPMLHAFAKDFLKITYMFWVNQPPYFETDVLTCFTKES